MKPVLIIGSGPAAAGAALALSAQGIRPTVMDIGLRLEPSHQSTISRLGAQSKGDWSSSDLAQISAQPSVQTDRGLPEKLAFGSDFPFRDAGQLSGITAGIDAQSKVISGAYGGFSNVWGSQVMPFTDVTIGTWPIAPEPLAQSYASILEHLPFSGEADDLARLFPLLRAPSGLPDLSPRSQRVLDSYHRHHRELVKLGITMGKARLAFSGQDCKMCGLCMTGCPYSLIYSASQTFDELRRADKVEYLPGLLALRLEEIDGHPRVIARDLATGQLCPFDAEKVLVACGALGTTRLVASSLGLYDSTIMANESAQFTIPMMSWRPVPDPRGDESFTLNQFNMVVQLDDLGLDLSQLHFYTYNDAFVAALPNALHSLPAVEAAVLKRTTVAIGYLPSWGSPRLRISVSPSSKATDLPSLQIEREPADWLHNKMLRVVLSRLTRAARHLDLWPILPKMVLSAGAKSYHFGSTFPHSRDQSSRYSSDSLGRVRPWENIHLIDASVFPNVPATTFTLTIMANAHRIASEIARVPETARVAV